MKKAVETLQDVAGASYPVLFLKMGHESWSPVGEEELCAVVKGKGETAAVIVCDSEGNTKAMSAWLPGGEAEKHASTLESRGVRRYDGEVKLPV